MLSFVLFFIEWTNGDTGILLPPIEILGLKINQFNATPSFVFAYLLMVASLILVKVIADSKLGLAFLSLRDSEVYAISRGINPYRTKLTAFVLSSWLTGICGAFYGHYIGTIGPWDLGWGLLVTLLASMVLGGLGTLYGPILGSFVLVFLNEYFRPLQLFRPTIYGLLLISTLIFLPNGLISILGKVRTRTRDVFFKSKDA
jgi:ABC-type branched-subunit amino acid transport system permease subunit